jgi:DNA-binding CsgD family transcriptional regulator
MAAPPDLPGSDARGRDGSGLSRREAEILRLIADGRTNAEICAELYLSINTVKTHIRSAYQKISARNRAEAVVWCFRNGLVDVTDGRM